MKKMTILYALMCMVTLNVAYAEGDNYKTTTSIPSNSTMRDWRTGIWNRDVSENLISINIEATPIMTSAFKPSLSCATGINAGFEHKMRPSIIHKKLSFGFGGHIGATRYYGKKVELKPIGNDNDITWRKYKSYTQIPVMLDANAYYNFRRSNISIGVSGGVNFMLGQRDARVDSIGMTVTSVMEDNYAAVNGKDIDIVSIQKDENDVSLSHIVPTFRINIGYTYELSQDFKIRAQSGLEYQLKFDDEYSGFMYGSSYHEYYHQHSSPAMFNPYFGIGLVYSL